MFRKFLLLLSLLFINPVYAATFSWALVNYAVNENVAGGAASLTIKRDTGTGSATAKIEIQTSGTTAVKGTNYDINDPRTTWTSGPPDYYNLSFSAGETSKKVYLKIINDTSSNVNKILVVKLSTTTSGYTISGNNIAKLTIVNTTQGSQGGGSGGSTAQNVDFYGNPVASYNPASAWLLNESNFVNTKYCFLRVDGGGICGMSYMKDDTNCHTSTTNYITDNYQVNLIGLNSMTGLWFGFKQSVSAAITMGFQTASTAERASFPKNIQSNQISILGDLSGISSPQGYVFISVSKTRCDFDYNKLTTQPTCYKTGAANFNIFASITRAPSTTPSGYCELDLNSKYYINIRIENANVGNRGNSSAACSDLSGVCKYGVQITQDYFQ